MDGHDAFHSGCVHQNPVYTGPQLAREEHHNPAGTDAHLTREENTYTVELHDDTTDYEPVQPGYMQQNQTFTNAHLTREERQESAYTAVHLTRAENIYTVEPHQGTTDYEPVQPGCVQQNRAYVDEHLTREERQEPAYAAVLFTRAENIYTVEPHDDTTDYEPVQPGCVQQNEAYADEHSTREERHEPAYTAVHITREANIYTVEPHDDNTDYEPVHGQPGCMQQNEAYADEQPTGEELQQPAYADVLFTRAENIYTVEPHQGTTDYEPVQPGCVQQNRAYVDEHLTREERQEPAYTAVHFTRAENIYTVEPHDDNTDYEPVQPGRMQQNEAYADEQPTGEELQQPALAAVLFTRVENIYTVEPHQDTTDYEPVQPGCVQQNRGYVDEHPTREERQEPAYAPVLFTRAENIYTVEPHDDTTDYEVVETGFARVQQNQACTDEQMNREEQQKPPCSDM